MSERIVLIGADEAALNGVMEYQRKHPDTEAIVIYPEFNPVPEFSCDVLERYLGRGIEFSEDLRASGVDTEAKRVIIRDHASGAEGSITYDKLIFAACAAPEEFDVLGDHIARIVRVGSHVDTTRLRPMDGTTLVIGSGLNLLMTVSVLLKHKKGSIEVILQNTGHLGKPMSEDLFAMVLHHLRESGVTIHEDHTLKQIEEVGSELKVTTDKGEFTASRVINAKTSLAVSYLAQEAGFETDKVGGIIVDGQLRTNINDVYACGGCASFISDMCKKPIPGTCIKFTEHRQSTALAKALEGTKARLFNPICTYSITLGDRTVAGAGLTVDAARECGFTPMSATAIQFDRAHFMPEADLMTLELVFDAPTRRVLGIQGMSKSGEALRGRISSVSAILAKRPSIDDIANLELAYSPPFASAMDVINTVANVADNMLAGINEGISATEFEALWQERENGDSFFLDCRELGNAKPFIEAHPAHWNHIPQGEIARRLSEIPEGKKIVLMCNTGTRSYEAQVTLKHAGFNDVANVDGGMTAVKQTGVKI
tara:strand:+ start:97015 stop:98637 length:1623 start_codon:yes stop_codon:yes gene_type:complete